MNIARIIGTAATILLALIILGSLGYVPGRQTYWDAKVRRLCEKEGGIKFFQTVNLDPNEYEKLLNNHNQLAIPSERLAGPADMYVYTFESEHIVKGSFEVRKDVQRVLKRPERIVLSEAISFSRVGGDFPLTFDRTSYSCPRRTETLFSGTFRKK